MKLYTFTLLDQTTNKTFIVHVKDNSYEEASMQIDDLIASEGNNYTYTYQAA